MLPDRGRSIKVTALYLQGDYFGIFQRHSFLEKTRGICGTNMVMSVGHQRADNSFTIEDFSCMVESVNPYGAVSSGKLRIRGKLILAGDIRDFYTEGHI
ncbi:hypothetical protein BTUL_0011g00290 [Botrytis tulipae]|uniref:Uncharacterized protein n=1 Tax=Botrytis tulipae TaxID=87230 RepID=A0A4Z1F5Z3_9HELO|nr:hypothetical protein BTUL_0011g00290 [Botrytis tulipae]